MPPKRKDMASGHDQLYHHVPRKKRTSLSNGQDMPSPEQADQSAVHLHRLRRSHFFPPDPAQDRLQALVKAAEVAAQSEHHLAEHRGESSEGRGKHQRMTDLTRHIYETSHDAQPQEETIPLRDSPPPHSVSDSASESSQSRRSLPQDRGKRKLDEVSSPRAKGVHAFDLNELSPQEVSSPTAKGVHAFDLNELPPEEVSRPSSPRTDLIGEGSSQTQSDRLNIETLRKYANTFIDLAKQRSKNPLKKDAYVGPTITDKQYNQISAYIRTLISSGSQKKEICDKAISIANNATIGTKEKLTDNDKNLERNGRSTAYRKSDKEREAQARYKQSDKGREAQARYKQSNKGREAQARYYSSEQRREAQAKYYSSEQRREAQVRYYSSDKGRVTKAKSNKTYYEKRKAAAEARKGNLEGQ